jgi:hypothetical protein
MGNPSGRLGFLGLFCEARIVDPRYRDCFFVNEHERDARASGGENPSGGLRLVFVVCVILLKVGRRCVTWVFTLSLKSNLKI